MTNISRPQFAAQLLESGKFEANLIHAVDFASVKLISLTCPKFFLAKKSESQQTCKQTVKHSSCTQSWNLSSHDHVFKSMKFKFIALFLCHCINASIHSLYTFGNCLLLTTGIQYPRTYMYLGVACNYFLLWLIILFISFSTNVDVW